MAQQARGSLLQMARMVQVKNPPSFKSHHKSAWDSPPTSDDERSTAVSHHTETPPVSLHTLTSAVSVLTQSLKDSAKSATTQAEERHERRRYDLERIAPLAPAGMDSNLFRTVYELGYDAGLARREPEPPCPVCKLRREKNRIAAAEQRKRQRQQSEDD
jgi:hypothetical protein